MIIEPFRFMTWLRLHGVDLLTVVLMAGIALGVNYAPPVPTRMFPIYNAEGSIVYPELAHSRREQIIPIWASALIGLFVPIFFFALFQIRRRSWDDFLTTTMGLLRSLLTSAVLQVIIKCLIGGLRPHFLAVCQPDITNKVGAGFRNIMFDSSVCTGNQEHIKDALKSMPSGHTTTAWAGLLYLALYFNAQLKVVSGHNPAYWKMILFFAPLLGAVLMSMVLVKDSHHHWYDIVVGGIIGSATALVAFRQTFAAIFDYRFNHLLLPRATSLFHRRPYLPVLGRGAYYTYQPINAIMPQDLPFAREGGWGYGVGEHASGAPGDATVLASSAVQHGISGAHRVAGGLSSNAVHLV
ncbi:lipid phosphate phosphatase 1 [Coprinopsis marcescibilis]|uniref:Lipid phosphate phosphatase 1 n=1 Tax=Coprinopsis marcescibilis TaxID=230819 RepID=A0A5C3KZI6_COPMA|nr:lipid phosphate phosphatase 1 [Coprinopsis marcescibilis]